MYCTYICLERERERKRERERLSLPPPPSLIRKESFNLLLLLLPYMYISVSKGETPVVPLLWSATSFHPLFSKTLNLKYAFLGLQTTSILLGVLALHIVLFRVSSPSAPTLNSMEQPLCLYYDHKCGRDQIPNRTVQVFIQCFALLLLLLSVSLFWLTCWVFTKTPLGFQYYQNMCIWFYMQKSPNQSLPLTVSYICHLQSSSDMLPNAALMPP